jgi:NTE family protein
VGSSTGAINGAVFAHDPTAEGVATLTESWRSVDTRRLVQRSRVANAVALTRRRAALNRSDGVRRMLEATLPARTFDALKVRFECVATDLVRADEHWFDRGSLLDAVLASCAIPVVLPPVEIDGVRYLDGGLVNDVPLTRAVERGATSIYVAGMGRLAQPWAEPLRPLGMGVQSYWVARKHRFKRDLDAVPAGVTVHLLPDGDPPPSRYHDVSQSTVMMEAAYAATTAYLAGVSSAG